MYIKLQVLKTPLVLLLREAELKNKASNQREAKGQMGEAASL